MIDSEASCIQRAVEDVTTARAAAMIVERRITRMPLFAPHLDVVEIPEEFFPPGPLTFTCGVMANARDRALADAYVDWICGAEGQTFFEKAGFIPAIYAKGQELVEQLRVHDES